MFLSTIFHWPAFPWVAAFIFGLLVSPWINRKISLLDRKIYHRTVVGCGITPTERTLEAAKSLRFSVDSLWNSLSNDDSDINFIRNCIDERYLVIKTDLDIIGSKKLKDLLESYFDLLVKCSAEKIKILNNMEITIKSSNVIDSEIIQDGGAIYREIQSICGIIIEESHKMIAERQYKY
jgi:hypothetical protein